VLGTRIGVRMAGPRTRVVPLVLIIRVEGDAHEIDRAEALARRQSLGAAPDAYDA
jgi:hypothetical protein